MSDRSVLWSNDAHVARSALETLLTECQGNVTLASRRAGIERQSMHRLLKRHGLSARDFRPRGGGSIIARAALKNLDQQLTPPQRMGSRDFARTVIREVEVRRPGVTVTHPSAIENEQRTAAADSVAAHERVAATAAESGRVRVSGTVPRAERVPLTTPAERVSATAPRAERVPLTTSAERVSATMSAERVPLTTPESRRDRVPLTTPESRRDRVPLTTAGERVSSPTPESRRDRVSLTTSRERASLASPSFDRLAPVRPAEERPPLIERPITAGELADRAFERRRGGTPHHRPYQSPLGAAALQALALRKTVAG